MKKILHFLKPIIMNKSLILTFLCALFSYWGNEAFGQCSPDVTPPTITAPADLTITSDDLAAMNLDPQDLVQLNQLFGDPVAMDNCGIDTVYQSVQTIVNNCGGLKLIRRNFIGFDNAGLASEDEQFITVLYDFSINIPKDFLPGDLTLDTLSVVQGNGTLLAVSYSDVVSDYDCNNTPDLTIRTWSVINWCDVSSAPTQPVNILPRLALNNDNIPGDAYVALIRTDSVIRLYNGLPVQKLGPNLLGKYQYTQEIRNNYNDTIQLSITGWVFMDTLLNCTRDSGEPGLDNWTVKGVGQTTGQVYTATTFANGFYQLYPICVGDDVVEVSLDVPFNYGQTCPTTYLVNTIPNAPVMQDIPVQLDDECNLLEVNIASPFLRRCFQNIYSVSYVNYSAQTVPNAYVEVELDSFMEFTSSNVPSTPLGGNKYSFQVGDLAPGENGSFFIYFNLSCNAEMGQTHCTEAHIYPDTLCPVNPLWSGANIEVEGNCVGDEIHLSIKNTGTGDMSAPLDFIVVEDVIMYMQGDFNLEAGESQQLAPITSNGETWRLEAQQVPSHPYPGIVSVTLEGCNGLNTTGLVNLYPTNNPNPFVAMDCQENIGSFDPNDKAANPIGRGVEHYIPRNTDIEYTIRFQNTGTDTAFTVAILDTLSQYLDPTTIRPGAGSHPFSFEEINGVLRFTFSNIELPSKDANEPASHGFIRFTAKQKPALALETVIENKAAIYFDFNEPVITNTVFHTIGQDLIEVLNDANETSGLAPLKVFPNPASEAVTFLLPVDLGENASFQLHDNLGKLVNVQAINGNQFRFERKNMAAGIYFFAIGNEKGKLYSGKIILK